MQQKVMHASTARRTSAWVLSVSLHPDEKRSQELARELVTEADLIEARSEVWLEGVLRKGNMTSPFEALQTRVLPIQVKGREFCTGYALEANAADGSTIRREFTLRSLHHVATRAAQRLQSSGLLQAGDLYFYELGAAQTLEGLAREPLEDHPFRIVTRNESFRSLSVPLAELMQGATSVGSIDDGSYPVFYTQDALQKAERYARQGAEAREPVETGAVLIGSICSCPQTGEMFVVISEVLEAADTQQTRYSLYYSDRTWARIQTIVDAIQQQPETRTQRIVGQAHGHNFLPANGAAPCETCPKVAVCSRTSVFVSEEDLTWSRAVFHRQPWALCQIFGLNARGEKVSGLFGQRDGRLLERGYYVVPEFDLAAWSMRQAANDNKEVT